MARLTEKLGTAIEATDPIVGILEKVALSFAGQVRRQDQGMTSS